MTTVLSDNQQQTLLDKRLPEDSRPAYFDAERAEEVQVGSAFEDFAILLDPGLREEILDRLDDASEIDDDYNTLLNEALDAEEDDADTMLADFRVAVDDYGTFRQALIGSYGSGAPEVAALQHDIRRNQGRLVEGFDYHYHRRQLARLIRTVHELGENNSDAEAQRQSWKEPLGVYR